MYYILNDNIYQGPSLYTVINERLVSPRPPTSLREGSPRATLPKTLTADDYARS